MSSSLSELIVLDFGWNWAGAMVGRYLADLGAQVIKIESVNRFDPVRYIPGKRVQSDPAQLGKRAKLESGPFFHCVNRGKLGMALDMSTDEGKSLFEELVSNCDVINENFSAGVLDRMGFPYERLRNLRKDIIVLSQSISGQQGPRSRIKGYAPISTGLGGLDANIGYDGESVGNMTLAYGDTNAAVFGLIALAAALYRRQQTGQGAYLDLAQMEAVTSMLHEACWYQQLDRSKLGPNGNCDDGYVINDTFACAGADQYIAVSILARSDVHKLSGLSSELSSALETPHDKQRLKGALASWIAQRSRCDACESLQALGIAATRVLSVSEVEDDTHFKARGLASTVEHPIVGTERTLELPWKFSAFKPQYVRAPYLGEHTANVLKNVLSKSDAEIDRLMQRAAV